MYANNNISNQYLPKLNIFSELAAYVPILDTALATLSYLAGVKILNKGEILSALVLKALHSLFISIQNVKKQTENSIAHTHFN